MRQLIYIVSMTLLCIIGWGIYEVASFGERAAQAPANQAFTDKDVDTLSKNAHETIQQLISTGANFESREQLTLVLERFQSYSAHPNQQTQNYIASLRKLLQSLNDDDYKQLNKVYPTYSKYSKLRKQKAFDKSTLFLACSALHERKRNTKDRTVLSFVGDTAFGTYPEAPKHLHFDEVFKKNKGDNTYVFKNVQPWFQTDDLTIMNAESAFTTATKAVPKMWRIKSHPKHVAFLPPSSVEVANLANNHSHDYYEVGYRDTLDAFKKHDVATFNTDKPYIKTVDGIQIVLLGYDYRMRDSSPKNSQKIVQDVKKYKQKDNLVIVNMHWGVEYRETPVTYQQQYAHAALDAGADLIIGHHPHRLQSVEKYKGKYIFYSIGDFAFGADPTLKSIQTAIVRTSWKKTDAGIKLADWWIVPTLENSDGSKTENNYQPLPVFGEEAKEIVAELERISSPIPGGVKTFPYFDPFSKK
ncbi:MAG: CapA family protein [Bacilli bacterium]